MYEFHFRLRKIQRARYSSIRKMITTCRYYYTKMYNFHCFYPDTHVQT